jgi:hypothetical protein
VKCRDLEARPETRSVETGKGRVVVRWGLMKGECVAAADVVDAAAVVAVAPAALSAPLGRGGWNRD